VKEYTTALAGGSIATAILAHCAHRSPLTARLRRRQAVGYTVADVARSRNPRAAIHRRGC